MNDYPNARDCEHGRQRGKCRICELEAELAECKKERDQYDKRRRESIAKFENLRKEYNELKGKVIELEKGVPLSHIRIARKEEVEEIVKEVVLETFSRLRNDGFTTDADQVALSPNSAHVMICEECCDREYPDGHESITLGLMATRACGLCGKSVSPQDGYSWLTRRDFVNRYGRNQ